MQKGVIAALGSAFLFGMSTPLAKILLGSVPPFVLAGLLYVGSGLGLAFMLAGRRLGKRASVMSLPRGSEWAWLAGAIFFGGVIGPVALMYGLVTTTASTASLLLNLETIFTALVAWFLFRENFDRRIVLGMLAIVAGGAVLVWTGRAQPEVPLGLVLIAAACLCWAIDNNLTRRVSANDAVFIAGLKGWVAGAVNLGLALLVGQVLPSPGALIAAMAVGFLGYGVSLVLFVLALRHLGAARTGAYFSVAPFFGAALAVLIQGDAVTLQLIAAGLLMAAGVWLHVTEHHSHLHEHEQLEHTHAHSHDEHHRHSHDHPWDGTEPHSHPHVHRPIVHLHAHYPDVHHRHPHK